MLKQKHRGGFTLIELLVVIAIIGVLAAILIPNLLGAIASAGQSTDRNNLNNLMESFVAGQGQGKPVPGSTGYQFWLALFVGDGPGGTVEVRDHEDEDRIYLRARSASMLRSPGDDGVDSRENIQSAIERAIADQTGVTGMDITHVSYAGPRGTGTASSPRTALLSSSRNHSGLVGTTGSRGGIGFFSGGFNAVNQDGGADWYSYRDLADDDPGYNDADGPLYEQGILEWVESFEGM